MAGGAGLAWCVGPVRVRCQKQLLLPLSRIYESVDRHMSALLSVHPGSDKLSMYPILARATQGMFHVKTAGTSYLEALRVVGRHDLGRILLCCGNDEGRRRYSTEYERDCQCVCNDRKERFGREEYRDARRGKRISVRHAPRFKVHGTATLDLCVREPSPLGFEQ